MEQVTIPTLNNPQRIELQGGGVVHVRRMKSNVNAQLCDAAKFDTQDNIAGAIRFGNKVVQWGIVEACDIPNPESPEEFIETTRRKVRGIIGEMANEELAVAIQMNNQEDFDLILATILGDKAAGLSEKQLGNSESSPDGSPDSE